jgi:hypothetical protein
MAMGIIKIAHMHMESASMILTLIVLKVLVHMAMGIDPC